MMRMRYAREIVGEVKKIDENTSITVGFIKKNCAVRQDQNRKKWQTHADLPGRRTCLSGRRC